MTGVDDAENDWKLDLFCRLHWPTETAVLKLALTCFVFRSDHYLLCSSGRPSCQAWSVFAVWKNLQELTLEESMRLGMIKNGNLFASISFHTNAHLYCSDRLDYLSRRFAQFY